MEILDDVLFLIIVLLLLKYIPTRIQERPVPSFVSDLTINGKSAVVSLTTNFLTLLPTV